MEESSITPQLQSDSLLEPRRAKIAILATTFIISVCGISYELLTGTVSSYFIGNATLQYSLTIGIFLSAMGIGSYFSRNLEKNLLEIFISVQIIVGLLGGFSTMLLYIAYQFTPAFFLLFFIYLLTLGSLIGVEIPVLIRVLKDYQALKFSISDVLAFDYIGALAASILFPLLILPSMGLMHAAFFYGIINIIIAIMNIHVFSGIIKWRNRFAAACFTVAILLFGGLYYSGKMVSYFEAKMYGDEIIHTQQTRFQRIILTRYGDDMRLYLDGGLQFSSWDEYRYHEALVHPAMHLAKNREEVLILGGGDGLAAREVLKYPDVKRITLVDIDGEMVELCKTHYLITRINGNSLSHPKMNIVIQDAYKYMQDAQERFNVVIIDLPDPNNESLSRLYTIGFYHKIKERLARGGVICAQATSPYYARNTFWCIINTFEATGLYTHAFHLFVPSMGDWGFALCSNEDFSPDDIIISKVETEYLQHGGIAELFYFGRDESRVDTEINTLNTHKILQYYDKEWRKWQ